MVAVTRGVFNIWIALPTWNLHASGNASDELLNATGWLSAGTLSTKTALVLLTCWISWSSAPQFGGTPCTAYGGRCGLLHNILAITPWFWFLVSSQTTIEDLGRLKATGAALWRLAPTGLLCATRTCSRHTIMFGWQSQKYDWDELFILCASRRCHSRGDPDG